MGMPLPGLKGRSFLSDDTVVSLETEESQVLYIQPRRRRRVEYCGEGAISQIEDISRFGR